MATAKGPFYKALGARIRDARSARRITQEELARAVGLSRTSITNIEKGRQPVYVDVLCRIASVLGTRSDVLLPAEGTSADSFPEQMKKLGPETQLWVAKIIAPDTVASEDAHARPLLSSTKEGNRASRSWPRKKGASSS